MKRALDDIISRELPDGGFRYLDVGPANPAATAWAVMALKSSGTHLDAAGRGCDWLASIQHTDGRVSAVDGYDEAVWPTPLCILAWKCLQGYGQSIDAAIQFLLTSQGQHKIKDSESPAGHDTSIVGWPWIEKTHSWIEPTSLAMMALKSNGYANHPRTKEAARMIMDRQLPSGGWNYGNITVYGKELLPIPENTGQALCALGGMAGDDSVKTSLRYIVECLHKVRTPMALTWMLYGLGVWSRLPQDWENWVIESLALQKRYGPYDTVLLSQLVSVYFTGGKLIEILV